MYCYKNTDTLISAIFNVTLSYPGCKTYVVKFFLHNYIDILILKFASFASSIGVKFPDKFGNPYFSNPPDICFCLLCYFNKPIQCGLNFLFG